MGTDSAGRTADSWPRPRLGSPREPPCRLGGKRDRSKGSWFGEINVADRIKHLSSLLGNPDAKVRLYALDEIIRNAHRVTEGELSDILSRTTSDMDKSVARRASEGLAILEQRGFKQLRRIRAKRNDLGELQGGWEEDGQEREAAYRILDGVIEILEELSGNLALTWAVPAIEALGMFRHPASLGPLHKALLRKDTAPVAAQAIAQYPEETALPILEKVLKDPENTEVVPMGLRALGELVGEDSFGFLTSFQESEEPEVLEGLAEALGYRPEKEAEQLLLKLVGHRTPTVQRAAIHALGMIGEGQAAERLHSLFVDSTDARTQAAILTALGLIHRHESVQVLTKGLRSQDGRVRANAIEALAGYDLREVEASRHFGPALRDEDNRAQANAILALYPYDRDQATAALQRILKAKEARRRSSAAYIVGELQDPMLIQGLITMINTEQDREVLASSLRSIARIRNPEMRNGIAKLCRHPNDLVRGQSIQVFAALSGISEIRILEKYFNDESSPTVKATIVTAMGSLCDINHLSFLKNKLRDRDPRIVANAIDALDRVGSIENTELLQPYLQHSSPRVQANTLIALWHQGHLKAGDDLAGFLYTENDDQLTSAVHAAKAVASSLSPVGLGRLPMLRNALKNAFQNFSSVGVNAWEMFRTSQFYQDVILGTAAEDGGEEYDSASESLEVALTIESSQEVPAADSKAPPETRGELATVAALGALLGGQNSKVGDLLGKVEDPGSLRGLMAYLQYKADPQTPVELSGPAEEEGFLPLWATVIEKAKDAQDFRGVLKGYFRFYRAQVDLLGTMIELGEEMLEGDDEGGAARVAKKLAQALKGDAELHRRLGNLHFAQRDFPKAHAQLLRAWLHTPDDAELLLKLASVSARVKKKRIAKQMIKILEEKLQPDAKIQAKAQGLKKLL